MNYWQRRIESLQQAILSNAIQLTEAQILAEYKKLYALIDTDIQLLYYELIAKEYTANTVYSYNRYYELLHKLANEINRLGKTEKNIMQTQLDNCYKYTEHMFAKELHWSTDIDVAEMEAAINAVWTADGLSWSDRIWKNKDALKMALIDGLSECLAAGKPVDYLTHELRQRCMVSYKEARRLARTELAHARNLSALNTFKAEHIDKVNMATAQDERTCAVCIKLEDGNPYLIDEAPLIPVHPNCRCTVLPYIEGVDYTRTRKGD